MQIEKDSILKDILEIVTFIKDNAVSKDEFSSLDSKVSSLETKVTKIQAEMVTKEYLDEKLDDLEAEIGGRINRRAEHENKFKTELVTAMKRRSVLPIQDLAKLQRLI